VIAANSDGVWNTEGATLSIVVIPPFWRTWWFLSLSVLVVAGLAFAGYKYRVTRLREAHAQQEAFSRQLIDSQEQERKRIAAELHDSLGQNLLIIKNRALLGTAAVTKPEAAKAQFDGSALQLRRPWKRCERLPTTSDPITSIASDLPAPWKRCSRRSPTRPIFNLRLK
jgi:signal transduction histidine kinase